MQTVLSREHCCSRRPSAAVVARTHAHAASRKPRCAFATRLQSNPRFLGRELALPHRRGEQARPSGNSVTLHSASRCWAAPSPCGLGSRAIARPKTAARRNPLTRFPPMRVTPAAAERVARAQRISSRPTCGWQATCRVALQLCRGSTRPRRRVARCSAGQDAMRAAAWRSPSLRRSQRDGAPT